MASRANGLVHLETTADGSVVKGLEERLVDPGVLRSSQTILSITEASLSNLGALVEL